MLVRQVSGVAASGALFALAGLHAAWGAGSAWPFPSRRELADAVIGTSEVPAPAACFAVSGALAAAGALVAGWPRGQPALRRIGVAGVVGVLAGRGGLGLSGQTRLVSPAVALGAVLTARPPGVLPVVPRTGRRIGPVGMARETRPGWRVSRRRPAASPQARDFTAKSASAVLTVPAVRPGARWNCQYRFVWAMTLSGGGAPYGVRSSVVCASLTSVVS